MSSPIRPDKPHIPNKTPKPQPISKVLDVTSRLFTHLAKQIDLGQFTTKVEKGQVTLTVEKVDGSNLFDVMILALDLNWKDLFPRCCRAVGDRIVEIALQKLESTHPDKEEELLRKFIEKADQAFGVIDRLDLSGGKGCLTAEDLKEISKLVVISLNLSGVLTDAKELGLFNDAWGRLKTLNISHSSLTNEIGSYLERFNKLEELDITGCAKLNDGLIPHLAKMQSLRTLYAGGTNLTKEKTEKALPDLTIVWNFGSF